MYVCICAYVRIRVEKHTLMKLSTKHTCAKRHIDEHLHNIIYPRQSIHVRERHTSKHLQDSSHQIVDLLVCTLLLYVWPQECAAFTVAARVPRDTTVLKHDCVLVPLCVCMQQYMYMCVCVY